MIVVSADPAGVINGISLLGSLTSPTAYSTEVDPGFRTTPGFAFLPTPKLGDGYDDEEEAAAV